MVREAVVLLRAWPFLDDDFFWLADFDDELFLLDVDLVDDALLCFFFGGDEESSAVSPLPCSNSSAARLAAVNRLRTFTSISVTRLRLCVGHEPVAGYGSLRCNLILCSLRNLKWKRIDGWHPAPVQFHEAARRCETIVGAVRKLSNPRLYNVRETEVVNTLKS